jgi:hypothetical protein
MNHRAFMSVNSMRAGHSSLEAGLSRFKIELMIANVVMVLQTGSYLLGLLTV